jgi:predicted small lipoprotein YifL
MQFKTDMQRLTLILVTCFLLTACGQKGDLYLPEGKMTALKTIIQ